MNENYFESQNQYRLYDVLGVTLENPNDFIIINEPSGYRTTDIELNRDKKTQGFNYEFSDEKKPYGFDNVKFSGLPKQPLSPRQLIVDAYEKEGGRCNDSVKGV